MPKGGTQYIHRAGLAYLHHITRSSAISGLRDINEPDNLASSEYTIVHFDLITQEMLRLQYIGGFHGGPGPHYSEGW